jgi:hypothetical protein
MRLLVLFLLFGMLMTSGYMDSLAAPKSASTRDVVGYIATAQREILLAAPVLRVKEIAQALRVAKAERGVNIHLLTGSRSHRDAASYWWSLHAAGLELRSVGSVTGYAILIDRRLRIAGDLIGRALEPDEPQLLEVQRGDVSFFVNRFLQVWRTAKPEKGVI